jgi:hypothetical protein
MMREPILFCVLVCIAASQRKANRGAALRGAARDANRVNRCRIDRDEIECYVAALQLGGVRQAEYRFQPGQNGGLEWRAGRITCPFAARAHFIVAPHCTDRSGFAPAP